MLAPFLALFRRARAPVFPHAAPPPPAMRMATGAVPTIRGEVARSASLARIADRLFERGIDYEVEAMVAGHRADLLLRRWDVVIEHTGGQPPAYRANWPARAMAYSTQGYRAIGLEAVAPDELETELVRKLASATGSATLIFPRA